MELTRDIIERFDPMLKSPKPRIGGTTPAKRQIMDSKKTTVVPPSRRRPELQQMKRQKPKAEQAHSAKTQHAFDSPDSPVDSSKLGPAPGSNSSELKRIKEEALGVVERVELILGMWKITEDKAAKATAADFEGNEPMGQYELDVLTGQDPTSLAARDKNGKSAQYNILDSLRRNLQHVGLQVLEWDLDISEEEGKHVPGTDCNVFMKDHKVVMSQGLNMLGKTFDQAIDAHSKMVQRMQEELQPKKLVDKVNQQKAELIRAKNDIWKLQAENEKIQSMYTTTKGVASDTNEHWQKERAGWSKIVDEFERQIKFLERLDAQKEGKLREVDTICRANNIDLSKLGQGAEAGSVPPKLFETPDGEDLGGLVKRLKDITLCFDPNGEEKELIVGKFAVVQKAIAEGIASKAGDAQQRLELLEMDMKRVQEELKRKEAEMQSHQSGHAKQKTELDTARGRIDQLQEENGKAQELLKSLQEQLDAAKAKADVAASGPQAELETLGRDLESTKELLEASQQSAKESEEALRKLEFSSSQRINELEAALQRALDEAQAKIDAAVAEEKAAAAAKQRGDGATVPESELSESREENERLAAQLAELRAQLASEAAEAQARLQSAEGRQGAAGDSAAAAAAQAAQAAQQAAVDAARAALEAEWAAKLEAERREVEEARREAEELRNQANAVSADNPEEFFEQRLRSANGRHEARLRSADGRSATAMKKAAEAEALLGAQRAKDAEVLAASEEEVGRLVSELDSMRAHLQRNKEEFARYEKLIQDQEAQSRLRSADGRRLLDAEKEAAAAAAAAAATAAANAAAGAALGESAQVAALKIEGLESKLSEEREGRQRIESEKASLLLQLQKAKKRWEAQRREFENEIKNTTAMSERAQQMYEVERRKVSSGMQVIEQAEKLLDVVVADHADLRCHFHDDEDDEDEAHTPSPGKLRPIADDIYSLLDAIEEMRTGVHAEKSNRARALFAQQQEERMQKMTQMMHGPKAKSSRFFSMKRISSLIEYLKTNRRGHDGFVEGKWTRDMLKVPPTTKKTAAPSSVPEAASRAGPPAQAVSQPSTLATSSGLAAVPVATVEGTPPVVASSGTVSETNVSASSPAMMQAVAAPASVSTQGAPSTTAPAASSSSTAEARASAPAVEVRAAPAAESVPPHAASSAPVSVEAASVTTSSMEADATPVAAAVAPAAVAPTAVAPAAVAPAAVAPAAVAPAAVAPVAVTLAAVAPVAMAPAALAPAALAPAAVAPAAASAAVVAIPTEDPPAPAAAPPAAPVVASAAVPAAVPAPAPTTAPAPATAPVPVPVPVPAPAAAPVAASTAAPAPAPAASPSAAPEVAPAATSAAVSAAPVVPAAAEAQQAGNGALATASPSAAAASPAPAANAAVDDNTSAAVSSAPQPGAEAGSTSALVQVAPVESRAGFGVAPPSQQQQQQQQQQQGGEGVPQGGAATATAATAASAATAAVPAASGGLVLEIPKSPDGTSAPLSYPPTDTPPSRPPSSAGTFADTPAESVSKHHTKHIAYDEAAHVDAHDGDHEAKDAAAAKAALRRKFQPLGDGIFESELAELLGFSNPFAPTEAQVDALPLSIKLEALRIVNTEGVPAKAQLLQGALKKATSYCDAVELTEQYVEYMLEKRTILGDPNGYSSRELQVVEGILTLVKKALHKSSTGSLQSLNNATNKDREKLLLDLDADGDGFLDDDDGFDKEAVKEKLEVLAIRTELLTEAVHANGGWQSVLFLPDGSLDTEVNLAIWSKDEQIEMLFAMKNYFLSKVEMATANARKRKRRGAIMHAAMKNVPASSEPPVDDAKVLGLASRIGEATRAVIECAAVVDRNNAAAAAPPPPPNLPAGTMSEKISHVESQSSSLVDAAKHLKTVLEQVEAKRGSDRSELDAEISRLRNELSAAEGESSRLELQLRDATGLMNDMKEASATLNANEEALKAKINDLIDAESRMAETVAGLNFQKLRQAKEITSLGTELQGGVDKKTAAALDFRRQKLQTDLSVVDEALQGLNKSRGENLRSILDAVRFVRHVSQVVINGKAYPSIKGWAEQKARTLDAIAHAARVNELSSELLAARSSYAVLNMIDSPRVTRSAMSRHRPIISPAPRPPNSKGDGPSEAGDGEPIATQTHVHSGTINFIRTDQLLAQRPRSPEDIVAFVHAKDIDRVRETPLRALADGYAERLTTDGRQLLVDTRRSSPVARMFEALNSPETPLGDDGRTQASSSLSSSTSPAASPRGFGGWGKAAHDRDARRSKELRPIKNKRSAKSEKKIAKEILAPRPPPALADVEGMCDFSTGGASSLSSMSSRSSHPKVEDLGLPKSRSGQGARSRAPSGDAPVPDMTLDFTLGGPEPSREVAESHGPSGWRPKKLQLRL